MIAVPHAKSKARSVIKPSRRESHVPRREALRAVSYCTGVVTGAGAARARVSGTGGRHLHIDRLEVGAAGVLRVDPVFAFAHHAFRRHAFLLRAAWPGPRACSRSRSASPGWRRIRVRPATWDRHNPSRPRHHVRAIAGEPAVHRIAGGAGLAGDVAPLQLLGGGRAGAVAGHVAQHAVDHEGVARRRARGSSSWPAAGCLARRYGSPRASSILAIR